MKAGRRAILAGLLLSLAAGAWAKGELADLPLEALLEVEIAGAARFAQPLSEAPATGSVILAEDIRRYGFTTLAGALQSLNGVHVTSERDYGYIGIRGIARPGDYNTRMLLMTDGVRRNDPLYDTAPIGHDAPLEMDWIKRLEFVRGPGSALYGANALLGVANAVLWSGADLKGSRLTAEAGSHGMARLGFLSGDRTEAGTDWVVGLSTYERRGEDLLFKDVPGVGSGYARGLDGERYLKALAKATGGNWKMNAGFSSRRKGVPTAYYNTLFNTPGNFIVDEYAYLDLGHSATLAPDWTQNATVRLGGYRYTGEYIYDGLLNRDEAQANWWGLDYLLTYTGAAGHRLLLGAELQRNQRLSQRNFNVAPAGDVFADRRAGNAVGLFVQDEWRLGRRWLLNVGARADQVAGFSAVSPRGALIFLPLPEASLKLLHGAAFRPPNSYERYYNDGSVIQKSNPGLRAERVTSTELAADYAISPRTRITASLYRSRMVDFIEQITDPADGLNVSANRTPIDSRGVEVEVESLLAGDLRLRAGLASQTTRQDFGAAVNSPHLMGKFHLDGPVLPGGANLGLALRAMTRRATLDGEVPAQLVVDAVASGRFDGRHGEWRLGIYNLGGKRHLDPASANVRQRVVAQDGRQLRLTWTLMY